MPRLNHRTGRWETAAELRHRLELAEKEHARVDDEASALAARCRAEPDNEGVRERLENVQAGASERARTVAGLRERLEDEERQEAETMRRIESGETGSERVDDRWRDPEPGTRRAAPERDGALRALERCLRDDELSQRGADHLDAHLRRERGALDSRYVAAVADPHYGPAFGKLLRDPVMGYSRMTREEVDAIQRVNAVESERAALAVGTGSAGGFALPISVDPTLQLSSNGAINPFRELAQVRTMTTRELRLVTSDGGVAQYQAEGAEALDNSPVLAQPVLIAQRATSFVPFSFEVDQDWETLRQELAMVIADAKDVLEATKFLTGAGSGSSEPVGILAVGTSGALSTSQRVQTDVAATLDVDDIWDIKGQLGNTRFAAGATWVANPGMLDRIYRFTPAGSTTEPQAMPTREGPLCGIPHRELSTMVNTTTTGSRVAILGNWRNFTIGDRLGMSLEIVPFLLGATNRYPTGQRGAYAIWRNDSRVTVLNGFRYLEVL
jgi:HK97 family phage major capsid protein